MKKPFCRARWLGGCAVISLMTGCAVIPHRESNPYIPMDARLGEEKPLVERRSGLWINRRLSSGLYLKHSILPDNMDIYVPEEGGGFSGKLSRMVGSTGIDPRIHVQAVRTPVREFFMNLVSGTPSINMIVHPDVSGEISLELKNVSIDEVVAITCEMYPLDCRAFAGNRPDAPRGYKIFPWRLATQTYRVDFLPLVRRGRSETVVSAGNNTHSIATQFGRDQNSSITNSTNAGSSVQTEYSSDFWDDLEKTVRSILKLDLVVSSMTEHIDVRGQVDKTIERKRYDVKEKGIVRSVAQEDGNQGVTLKTFTKDEETQQVTPTERQTEQSAADIKGVMVNRQAGLITVRAFPKEHQDIVAFLEKLRIRSQRQVVLEAKILEVELSDGFQFGVDWLAINKGLGSSRFPPLLSEPNNGQTFLGNQAYPVGTGRSLDNFATPFTQGLILSQANVAAPFGLAIREHDFIGFIRLLQQQGTVQVLSSPRIATINNQKAVIKVGSDEFFITGLDSGSVIGSGDAAQIRDPTAIFTSMFTGVSLDVTPQIGEGNMVTLHVHPMVTDVKDTVKSFVINDKPQHLPLALSRTRETDSIIRVRNGEVAVIGGLMKNIADEGKNRLPLLGDLPIFGALFGQTEKKWHKSELVILLRPLVVDPRQGWGEQGVRIAERIQKMSHKEPLRWTR